MPRKRDDGEEFRGPGRPREYANDAERQRAYRERRRQEADDARYRQMAYQRDLRAALENLQAAVSLAANAGVGEWRNYLERHPDLELPSLLNYIADEIRQHRG